MHWPAGFSTSQPLKGSLMSKESIVTLKSSPSKQFRGRNSTIGELLPEPMKWRMEQLARGRTVRHSSASTSRGRS